MSEIMTLAEIQSRYDSEWVLVADPEVDEQLRVVRGKVVFHSKSRDEFDRKLIELRLPRSAILYTGRMPENTAIVLSARSSRSSHTHCRPQPRWTGC
jgi:hypothetical protein